MIRLEEEMSKRDYYDQIKEEKIANLKVLLEESGASHNNRYFLTNKLISEYMYYSFDNTLLYINENIDLAQSIGNDSLLIESNLKLSKILATSGRYIESLDVLKEIDRRGIPKRLIGNFYHNYKWCYADLRIKTKVKSISEKYHKLYLAYKDSLNFELSKLDKIPDEFLFVAEQNYRDLENSKKALEVNANILSKVKSGTRAYSMATFSRSYMSWDFDKDIKDITSQKKFLMLSAISDIQGSIKDNAALTDLAVMLFEEGDVEKAHKFMNISLEDVKFYNSKLRFLGISNISPQISNSFEARIQNQSNVLEKQLLFISTLFIILLIALVFIYTQNKKVKLAKEELKAANLQLKTVNDELKLRNKDLKLIYKELSEVDHVKELYIGTFLNLYSDYIDKLDMYRKMVRKYIVTNKTSELLEITKSKKLVSDELKVFYSNFDKSFLHIYPNFIESFNDLLKEEDRIIVRNDEILNTELRIFALIRLGISNSSQISKILRYSVNTIYNYRVKIRNSALNRDEFEDMVKRIS